MSAGTGLKHWRTQRVTAILLVPLVLWFAYSMAALTGQPYPVYHLWVSGTLNAFLLGVLLLVVFRHAQLGLEEVIQDYVHAPGAKRASLMAVRVCIFALLAVGLLSILSIVVGV